VRIASKLIGLCGRYLCGLPQSNLGFFWRFVVDTVVTAAACCDESLAIGMG
jgi:hypothetical protein